jgi:hypothetical protein
VTRTQFRYDAAEEGTVLRPVHDFMLLPDLVEEARARDQEVDGCHLPLP